MSDHSSFGWVLLALGLGIAGVPWPRADAGKAQAEQWPGNAAPAVDASRPSPSPAAGAPVSTGGPPQPTRADSGTAWPPDLLRLDLCPLHDERQLDVHMVLGDLAVLDDGRAFQHVQAGDVPEGL